MIFSEICQAGQVLLWPLSRSMSLGSEEGQAKHLMGNRLRKSEGVERRKGGGSKDALRESWVMLMKMMWHP